MLNNLHIVTVATEAKFYCPYLVESCKKNGKELTVLGFNEEWKGFSWRFRKMINYLKGLPENDVVCFIDAYDVLCVRNLEQLIPAFLKIKKETGCKVVVGSDQHYTILKYWAKLTYGECDKKLLNLGNYIGMVKDVLDILQEIYYSNNVDDSSDDQLLFTHYCKKNPKLFYIDTTSRIFLVYMNPFTEVQDVTIRNNEVYYKKSQPFFIHTPGGFLDKLIIDLGYNYDYNNNIQEEIRNKVYSFSIFNQLKNGIYLFVWLFIIIIILIIVIYYIRNYKTMNKKIKTIINKFK